MEQFAFTGFRRLPKDMIPFLCVLLDAVRSDCSNTTIHEMLIFLTNQFKDDREDAKRTIAGRPQPNRVVYLLNFHDYLEAAAEVKNRDTGKINSLGVISSDILLHIHKLLVYMESCQGIDSATVFTDKTELTYLLKCLQKYFADILHLQYIFTCINDQFPSSKVKLRLYIAPELPTYVTDIFKPLCENVTDSQISTVLSGISNEDLCNRMALLTGLGASCIPHEELEAVWNAYMLTDSLAEDADTISVQSLFILQSEFWKFDNLCTEK